MLKIIILAIICESVWQTLKMVWQRDKYLTLDNLGALVVSLLVAFSTDIDLFKIFEIDSKIKFLGIILTGILLSRGSSFIHDLLSKLSRANEPKINE